jgi:hypothetical protein
MVLAVLFFSLAVLIGLSMALYRFFTGTNPPLVLVFFHAVALAGGFFSIAWATLVADDKAPHAVALALLSVPAVAGVYLVVQTHKGRLLQVPEVLMHGLFGAWAYTGLAILTFGAGAR